MKTKKLFFYKTQLLTVAFMTLLIGCNDEKFCYVDNYSLNKVSPYYDGQWQGITIGSDGACYFGTSSHNLIHGGGFFKFDPNLDKVEVITEDFTNLVGDDISKNTPQGKIHTPIIEVGDELYMATHLAAYWDDVLDQYAGSYFLSFNKRDKEWTNYGIVKEGFSTYSAIEVDEKKGKAYTMTVPFNPKDTLFGKHLFEIDLKTKEKRDLGELKPGRACFYFYLDDIGRVWASLWQGNGSLFCYDSTVDSIIEYKDAFPEPKLLGGEDIKNPPSFPSPAWTWVQPIEGGKKCLFAMGDFGGGDERLWLFDPHEDIPSKKAFTPLCDIGNTFLSVALGGDRVYFIQRGDNASSRNYNTEGMRDEPTDPKGYHINNLHLKSVSLSGKDQYKIIDHGRLIDKQGRTAAYIGSLAADDKGNVYMSGGWLIAKGDQPTMEYRHKAADGQTYAPLEHPGQKTKVINNSDKTNDADFVTLNRGEFFTKVNVSKDFNN